LRWSNGRIFYKARVEKALAALNRLIPQGFDRWHLSCSLAGERRRCPLVAGSRMTRLLTVGRPFGISIGLHSGWFVVASLLFLSMMDRLAESRPSWGGGVAATTCAAAALLFLIGVLWHEVAHAAV